MFLGTFDVLGTPLTACDHDFILKEIVKHIKAKKDFLISPLASQTFVLALLDKKIKNALSHYDYLFSDSLWVKRAMNFLYNSQLKQRIRGSNLMLNVCELAQKEKYKIFLYGTTLNTLGILENKLKLFYPKLKIIGNMPSKFAPLTGREKQELIRVVEQLKTDILLIALGSPLEQIFAYELMYKIPKLKKPIVVLPLGAAFDFISGVKPTAPKWMQKTGLEWLFRLICEPSRLWKRYLIYGPLFVVRVLFQKIQLLLNLSKRKVVRNEINKGK